MSRPTVYGYLIDAPRLMKWAHDRGFLKPVVIDPGYEEEGEDDAFPSVLNARSEALRRSGDEICRLTGIPLSMALVYITDSVIMLAWRLPQSYAKENLDAEREGKLAKLKQVLETDKNPAFFYEDDGFNTAPKFLRGLEVPEDLAAMDFDSLPLDRLF